MLTEHTVVREAQTLQFTECMLKRGVKISAMLRTGCLFELAGTPPKIYKYGEKLKLSELGPPLKVLSVEKSKVFDLGPQLKKTPCSYVPPCFCMLELDRLQIYKISVNENIQAQKKAPP